MLFGDEEKKGPVEELRPVQTTTVGEVESLDGYSKSDANHDAVFGEINEDGPNYKDVGWMGTVVLMMKTQIGLGVLGIPSVLHTLGMIPGIIVLIIVGTMTTWSGCKSDTEVLQGTSRLTEFAGMVGQFKLAHPQVYGIDDAGALMGGRIGRELLYWGFNIYFTFLGASAMLGISIGFNSLSTHGACTAIFVAVAAIIGFSFGSIQTLGKVSWIAWVGVAGILTAVFSLTVAVGVQDRPAAAPQQGPYESDFRIIGNPTFEEAISAVSTVVFAFAGSPAFFSIISEMRNPRDYTKSLVIAQGAVGLVYLVIGIVVYYFCGSYVASPALGSAGVTMKKVCYGLALPGLVASCMLFIHVSLALPSPYLSDFPLTTIVKTAPRQILLHALHARHKTSHVQHTHPLARLARLHRLRHNRRLPHRLRHPGLRRPHLSHRRLTRHRNVLSTHGSHVAVR